MTAYRVKEESGEVTFFANRQAVEQALANTATEEYTAIVREWMDSTAVYELCSSGTRPVAP